MTTGGENLYLFREFRRALDTCVAFVHQAKPGQIGFCVGPAGAGKSSIARAIGEIVYGMENTWATGTKPYIFVEADNPDRGFFSPKELIRSLLSELHDPFRSRISDITGWGLSPELQTKLVEAVIALKQVRISEPDMRSVFMSLGRKVGLKLIVIDEGNLLVLTQRGRTPTDYLESLRLLALRTGCCVLLFGTVDMLELMGYSAQLNRRLLYVHLDRFRCEDSVGAEEFVSFLRKIEKDKGLPPDLLATNAESIYAWTYGIPGEVVDLVQRTTVARIALKLDSVSWDLISSKRRSDAEIEQMMLEADIVSNVLNGVALNERQEKAVSRRRVARMKPRRIMTA